MVFAGHWEQVYFLLCKARGRLAVNVQLETSDPTIQPLKDYLEAIKPASGA
jgi:hypothetical protein